MKYIGLVIFFVFSTSKIIAFAQNIQISGTVYRQDSSIFLIPAESKLEAPLKFKLKSQLKSGQGFKITPISAEVQSALDLLKNGDYLSGSAEVRSNSNLLIYSIDYIGLNELLGSWKIKESGEVLNFVNFFTMERPGALTLTYLLSPKSTGLEIIISSTNRFVIGTLRNRTSRSFFMEFDNSSKILSFEKLK